MWFRIILPLLIAPSLTTGEGVSVSPEDIESSQGSEASVVLVYQGGELTHDEVESWLSFRPPRKESEAARQSRLGELVLLEVLERRFLEQTGDDDPVFQAWRGVLERRLSGALVDEDLRRRARPSDEEVERAFRAEPRRFDHPRLWRLQNIWLRYPEDSTEDSKRQLVERVGSLRAEILAGTRSFEEVARSESESTTRRRGGNMGTASLDRLQPAVARAVAELGPGEMTAPIRTGDGVTLIRCRGMIEPSVLTDAESRERHRQRLARSHLERLKEELQARLEREQSAVVERRLPTGVTAPPDAVVLRWADGGRVTVLDLEFFARDRGWAWRPGGDEERGEALLDRLVMDFARAREAQRLKLDQEDSYQSRLAWEIRLLRAELALRPAIDEALEAPSPERLRASYEKHRQSLLTRPLVELEALVLPIRVEEIPADVFHRFRALPEPLRTGLSFAEAASELAPWVTHQRWGTETDRRLWRRGLDIDRGVAELEVDGVSGVLQERQELFIVRLLDRQPARQLSFEEASPRLAAMLTRADRERERKRLRTELLGEFDLRPVNHP